LREISVASTDQLKALIKSHLDGDEAQFYSVAMQLAAHEAKIGHGKTAEEIRDLIDAAKSRVGNQFKEKLVPIGRPRGGTRQSSLRCISRESASRT
jgi:hypothetical protein